MLIGADGRGPQPRHGMSDTLTERSSKTWTYVLVMLVSLPLFYALSIGPAVVMVGRKVIPGQVLQPIYKPLEKFADATNTDEFFRSYIGMWLGATGATFP